MKDGEVSQKVVWRDKKRFYAVPSRLAGILHKALSAPPHLRIRINFPTLLPIVCRLFLGLRQRLLISICSKEPANKHSSGERPKVVRKESEFRPACRALLKLHQQRQTYRGSRPSLRLLIARTDDIFAG